MFQVSPLVITVSLVAQVLMGVILGLIAGFLMSLCLKHGKKDVWKDGLLGGFGFAIGVMLCVVVPWPQNTIISYVDGTEISSTMNRFQHPFIVGTFIAVLLPIVYEVYRK